MTSGSTYEECVKCEVPPEDEEGIALKCGDIFQGGVYYRHLKDDDVKTKYSDDDKTHPEYGWRIAFNGSWLSNCFNKTSNSMEMSVDHAPCRQFPRCVILINKGPSKSCVHVWELDLDLFRERIKGVSDVVAKYAPLRLDKDGTVINKCHFNLESAGGIKKDQLTNALKALAYEPDDLKGSRPTKMPGPTLRDEAHKSADLFDELVKIHRAPAGMPPADDQ